MLNAPAPLDFDTARSRVPGYLRGHGLEGEVVVSDYGYVSDEHVWVTARPAPQGPVTSGAAYWYQVNRVTGEVTQGNWFFPVPSDWVRVGNWPD